MNINDYTGLPYDFRKRNCWHHVRNVRADAGLETPAFDVAYPHGAQDMFEQAHADSRGLTKVPEPQDYDAVLLGYDHGNRVIWHSGVYYKGYISHCERAAKQVKLEALTDIARRYPRIEFWR